MRSDDRAFDTAPLAELCDATRGITYGIVKVGEFVRDGIPVVRGGGVRDNRIEIDDEKRVSEEVSRRFKRTILRGGEIVLNLIAEPGHSAIVPASLAGANVTRDIAVIPVAGADTRFVNYFLQSPQCIGWLRAHLQGSVTLKINLGTLAALPVPNPPIDEQRRIAAVLDALDEKTGSSRRLVGLLDETVATLFRARFVDFVGVDEFEESEIGRVPRGWQIAPVGEVLTVVGGSTPSTKEARFWNGLHCWATPKDLSGAWSPILLDTDRHITAEGVQHISSKLLPRRTVLLSSRAPVGYTAISFVPVAVNQGFIAIPPSSDVPSEFVLFWLREHMDEIKAHAGGTTFAEISKRQFRPLPMVVPPREQRESFNRTARPAFDLMAAQEREAKTLAELRNALLPKLISGQIRVPDTGDPTELIEPAAEAIPAAS
ncbi:MAG: restriction endonuclease subunit S [Solirubrobacterales bacterium]|nr:restriction endonuclease subunit S [Solirubrobacterales bacterium]